MDQELLESLTEASRRIFQKTAIFLAYAYGSRVKGGARPDSDLDVGYYLGGYRDGDRLPIRQEMIIADRLSAATGVEVDLRNLALAPLEMRGRVLEDGIRVHCSDERARVALERRLLSMYHDYKPELEAMHAARLAGSAEGVG